MLQKLTIRNIALIEQAEIVFTEGLNVLSGETGAGKSVILESLNFVLGAKADKTLIRTGEKECSVKAEFDISASDGLKAVCDELDIEAEDLLIVSRKFNSEGKSSIKVNGSALAVGMLKKLTSKLVDVHGQSEHFYLLNTANQLDLIDRIGGENISRIKSELKSEYSEYKNVVSKLDELGGDDSKRMIKLDILAYQIKEIEDANIKEGEEEELIGIRQKISNQEKICSALNSIVSAIDEDGGVNDVLSNITRLSSGLVSFGKDFSDLTERFDGVISEIDDIKNNAVSLLDGFDTDGYNADYIEDRLDLIKKLKRKYGNTVSDVFEFLNKAVAEKETLENYNDLAEKLQSEKTAKQRIIYDLYTKLSKERRAVSDTFAKNVLSELSELGITKGDFYVSFKNMPEFEDCIFDSSNGCDNIEFMFSANPGEPAKPLSGVISGGEMSRFMLSIKAQTARYNDISTFVFDEIDAGISGMTAKVVAEKFAKISLDTQLIAVSHLPQISAMADNNLLIVKSETENKTVTTVKTLDYEEKISEICRLAGGDIDSESAKRHSTELIGKAEEYKNHLKKSD